MATTKRRGPSSPPSVSSAAKKKSRRRHAHRVERGGYVQASILLEAVTREGCTVMPIADVTARIAVPPAALLAELVPVLVNLLGIKVFERDDAPSPAPAVKGLRCPATHRPDLGRTSDDGADHAYTAPELLLGCMLGRGHHPATPHEWAPLVSLLAAEKVGEPAFMFKTQEERAMWAAFAAGALAGGSHGAQACTLADGVLAEFRKRCDGDPEVTTSTDDAGAADSSQPGA